MHPLEPWQAASAQLAHLRVQRVAVLLRDHDGSCARPALLPCKRVLQRLALIKSFVRAMRAKKGKFQIERNEATSRFHFYYSQKRDPWITDSFTIHSSKSSRVYFYYTAPKPRFYNRT